MTTSKRSLAAAGSFSVALVLSVVAIPGAIDASSVSNEEQWAFPGFGLIASLVFAVCGALLAFKRPENPVGWLFGAVGIAFAALTLGDVYAGVALVRGDEGGINYQVGWFNSWSWIIFVGLVAFAILLFPSGHLPGPRWRLGARLMAAGFVLGCLAFAFAPGPLNNLPAHITNRYALPDTPMTEAFTYVGALSFIGALAASAIGVIQRFRASSGVQRQQMKLFSYAAGVLAVSMVMIGVGSEILSPAAVNVLELVNSVAVMGVPLAMAVAILRYRLYDIDVVVNRTLVYGGLTAVLGLAYLTIVVVLQSLLEPITRDSDIAIAASTLAVAALARPVRDRIQRFIDRRFYRRKYDAVRTVGEFSSRLRDQVDLESLRAELVDVVSSTMQPAHASLWLRIPEETR